MLFKNCEANLYNIVDDISDEKDKNRVIEAYKIAKNAHEWQKRKSWEAYITHPLAVSISLWKKFEDVDLLISWLLHDTVEDCDWIDMKFIYSKFWKNIWFIVDSVTKTERNFLWDDNKFDDERDKMLYWGMHNIWCILVKLADREHNLATLSFMPKHKQVKKSFESQSLYIPLTHILWFNNTGKLNILNCHNFFKKYILENSLKNHKEIKNKLLNICFNDFSEDLFDVVYNNSTSVVWELEDKSFFDNLVESGWFDTESVEIKSIKWTSKWDFKATFIYRNWVVFKNMTWKINISKNSFIS